MMASAVSTWYHTIIAPQGQTLWAGSLWSNMYAWVICGILALFWGHREFVKLHRKIDRHHEELKAHITATHKGKK